MNFTHDGKWLGCPYTIDNLHESCTCWNTPTISNTVLLFEANASEFKCKFLDRRVNYGNVEIIEWVCYGGLNTFSYVMVG